MRPTIPLGLWRLAVDVAATRRLAAAAGPECGRACPWCRNWAAAHTAALPAAVVAELRRLGLDPARPLDLYASAEPDAGAPDLVPHRVVYAAVAAVLSGPPVHAEHPGLGPVRRYEVLPGPPGGVHLSVVDERAGAWAPAHPPTPGPVVQVDLRLVAPWVLPEPRPPAHAAGLPAAAGR